LKKLAIASLVSLVCLTILLPVIRSVNHSTVMPVVVPGVYQVDGNPMPPPLPPWRLYDGSPLVADGNPMPPPLPPWNVSDGSTLVADGNPMPPPLPPWNLSTLQAA